MATGGAVPGQTTDGEVTDRTIGGEVTELTTGGAGSEDLGHVKCQPCLEIGDLHEVAGMCIDCDEYMCDMCLKHHRMHKPSRQHRLIDREQMAKDNIRARTSDTCTEKCQNHEDDVIKYFCVTHCVLGCTLCITEDHKTCEEVRYIPRVAKELETNEEYCKGERNLKSAIDTLKAASENIKQNAVDLEASCLEALKDIRVFRRKIDETLGKLENELIKQAQDMKSTELNNLDSLGESYKATLEQLQSSLANIEALQKASQHCSSYTEMMRSKARLASLDSQIKEAEIDKTDIKCSIQFSPNKETLSSIEQSDTFGVLSWSSRGQVTGATHAKDLNARAGTDTSTCGITGMAVLPGDRLVVADHNSTSIKIVDAQNDRVMKKLKLSSLPWDLTVINSNKVAVTLREEKKIAIVAVVHNSMINDRTLDVNGICWGIDYKNNQLVVSFSDPSKIQIITLQGSIVSEISNLPSNWLPYLTWCPDDTLYVSNSNVDNVVVMKLSSFMQTTSSSFDTYSDKELQHPRQTLVDTHGDVFVIGHESKTVHVINKDSQKIRVLLSEADGLFKPNVLCFSEKKDKLYVGMDSDTIKVYKLLRSANQNV